MEFTPSGIADVWILELERYRDNRGWFARTWCREEFRRQGLQDQFDQCSTSFNSRRGIIRGLHFQVTPYQETKLVRCTRGALFDVALDVRPTSPTFKRWVGVELTPDNGRQLYLGPGVAHGFQTLADNTEVFYQITTPWRPDAARGVRWNDPAFGIHWPLADQVLLSERDARYPDFRG